MKLVVLPLMLMFGSVCHAQTVAPVIKPADLQADVAILRSAYEQLHPGLYRYNSKPEMAVDFAALSRQLDHDQTLQDAFLAFSEFAAKVKCGHTQANPFNQSDALRDALFKSPTRLPFYFDWIDRRMIVTRDFTPEHALPAGTEVTRINGVQVAAILDRLLSIARADGANDNKRIAQLAVNGDSEYETFDLYFPMYFPSTKPSLALEVRRPASRAGERITVVPLTFDQRIAPIHARETKRNGGDEPVFEWKDQSDGSAYLRMPTWALYNSEWNWKAFLDQHLEQAAARHAPALILDLRGNEGGDDVGNVILPHLIDTPLALSTMRRLVRYRKIPDDLRPYLDTWDASFRDWGSSAVDLPEPWPTAPAGINYLKLSRYDDGAGGDIIQPHGLRFGGKVFVLIDATNSSATFQFAQNIQSHHLGSLVGMPTGGSLRGINGGAFFFLRLPHSGIELDLPLIGTFPSTPQVDAGLTPDILVKPSIEDIAGGHDAALSAVMHAIN